MEEYARDQREDSEESDGPWANRQVTMHDYKGQGVAWWQRARIGGAEDEKDE